METLLHTNSNTKTFSHYTWGPASWVNTEHKVIRTHNAFFFVLSTLFEIMSRLHVLHVLQQHKRQSLIKLASENLSRWSFSTCFVRCNSLVLTCTWLFHQKHETFNFAAECLLPFLRLNMESWKTSCNKLISALGACQHFGSSFALHHSAEKNT